MALGGGTWTYQDKILPGTYINFTNPSLVSSGISERGTVAVPLSLNWGAEGEVITLTSETILSDCEKLIGYDYSQTEALPLRELFQNAQTVYVYRLGTGAVKASNIYCQAIYGGVRGNDIKISISESIDKEDYYQVTTYLDNVAVETQEVSSSSELVQNDYVSFYGDTSLAVSLGLPLTGGVDPADATGSDYSKFLSAMENYAFDILCLPTDDADTISLAIAYTKRMVDECGANFQLVCYRPTSPDWEGVIAVENEVLSGLPEWGLVYWVAGAQASCSSSQSLTGTVYSGELTLDLEYTQTELKQALTDGKFMLHSVNGTATVLRDINSFTSYTYDKGEDFSSNQTVRVCFSIANSIATLFNERYLGKVQNDKEGRISLWNDICKILETLESSRAISDFNSDNVAVEVGETKEKVVCTISEIVVAGSMEALYMNVVVM